MLTLTSNVLGFLKNGFVSGEFNDYQEILILHIEILKKKKKRKNTFAHIFTLQLLHIFEILVHINF